MKTKMILALVAAVLILSAGSAGAKEIEFSLIDTASMPQNSLFSSEVMNMTASMAVSYTHLTLPTTPYV